MPSLWFVVPAHGRAKLAAVCLKQLRRTCDALTDNGVNATAVIVADDDNLRTARKLGFATIRRDNRFLSQKFNDGIQAALDPHLQDPPLSGGVYEVVRPNGYRGHPPGTRFTARIDENAARRALARGDIRIVDQGPVIYPVSGFRPPRGWDGKPADYVVPCGSDDWVDWRILLPLPERHTVRAFQRLAFVREDGLEIRTATATNLGGCGIRVYPRHVMALTHYRPADEDRTRACDTSILTNLTRAYQAARKQLRVVYGDQHDTQIVDWKSRREQINPYDQIVQVLRSGGPADPYALLADTYPPEALAEMAAYHRIRGRRLVAA